MTPPQRSARSPSEVAEAVGGRLDGSPDDVSLSKLSSPASVAAGRVDPATTVVVVSAAEELGVLSSAAQELGLLVVPESLELSEGPRAAAVVRVADPRLALARLTELFDTRPSPATGEKSASSSVHRTATVGLGVTLCAGAVVGPGAKVGDRSVIGPNSVIGAGGVVGADCVLHANVTVYDGVVLGDRVVIHSGTVIGADGFGYAAHSTGAVKVRHLGGVRIEDDVEIGANTAVDRGTLDDTVIGRGTKIDNLCQVGHNVRIGRSCLIAGMTGIAGSVKIGDGVIMGGAVGIADHVSIGAGARIAGRSGITKDVPPGETWAGFPARPHRQYARSLYLQERLEDIWKAFKRLDRG